MRATHRQLFAAAFLATAGLATAQMSGTYTISPTGSGNRNFKTFLEASKALFAQGVSAPVDVIVTPGLYVESFFLLPVQGASGTSKIRFFTPVPGSVKLQGAPADTVTFFNGLSWFINAWYVFDGLEFVSAPGYVLRAGGFCQDIEFTNCIFQAAHMGPSPAAMAYIEGANTALRWSFHHNKITLLGSPTANRTGFYLSQVGQFEIYNNDIDLNSTGNGFYFINLNDARNRIYNNLFYGALYNSASSNVINVALSNLNNDIAHNTFFVTTGAAGGNLISTFGTSTNLNRIYGNVLALVGVGTCINVNITSPTLQFWESNGNLFFAPAGEVGRVGTTVYTTLAAWQAGTLKDAASLVGDPQFLSTTAPLDLHVRGTSPVRDAAANTPTFVVTDYDGRPRDTKPDIGAYELGGGFATFGSGCAGSGAAVPAIGSTGTVAIGSTNFAVNVARGLGGAPALLAIGASNTRWGGSPLPLDLGGGCAVRVAPLIIVATALTGSGAGNGTASIGIPIPNDPALSNQSVYFQWIVIDAQSGSPLGITTSNGGAARL